MKTIIIISSLFLASALSFGQGLVNNNGKIICNGTVNVVIEGDGNWTNNGTFTADDSEVIFHGNSNQTINGSTNSRFNDLTINKATGDALLGVDILVSNNLTLTNGDLDLQNNTIDLQGTGVILSETEDNRIKVGDPTTNTGEIKYTRTINNVTDFDPANLGVIITTDQDLGSTTVVRGHKSLEGTGSFAGNNSIARYYDISGIGELDGGNVNIKMQYWDSELGGSHPMEANLIMYQSLTQSGDDFWTELSTNINTGSNTLIPIVNPYDSYVYGPSYSNITFNDRFTFGSSDSPLPIELLSFNAKKDNNNSVKLEWETSTEINNDYFILEKSVDNTNWEFVSRIDGAGNSNTIIKYFDYDYSPYKGLSFYRLKQIDYDGKYTYSDIKSISFESDEDISIYPNPTNGIVNISGNNISSIEILSMHGKTIKAVLKHENRLDLTSCKKGTYIIKIATVENVYFKKLIIN